MLLAVLGGIAGLLLAYWMAPILAALNPIRDIAFGTFFHHFEIDRRVLGFALVVSLLTGVIFGLLPAIKGSTEGDLIARIKQGEQRTGGAASGRRWLNGLIVTEIAIAMTLLICGGLILQSFNRLQHVELGFNPDNLLTMKMVLPAAKYSEHRQRIAFVDRLLDRVRRLPGVISAGVTTNIPLEREITYDARFEVERRPPAYPGEIPITSHRLVSPGYLRALGVTLIKGRLLEERDRAGTLPVVIVSQELARQAWPNDDAIGKHVRSIRAGRTSQWMTVVGVVRDVKEDLFNYRINRPVWYLPYAQAENDFPINLVVRASLNPTSLTAAVRDVVRSVDPDQPVSNVMTMRENLGGVLVTERFSAILLGGLAATGLLLASIGLYGVMAYSVSQRTAEIGLRVAVGAEPRHIRGLILEQGMKLTLCGIGIGFLSAWCAARFVAGLLFGLSAADFTTFSGIAFVLAAVGLLACYLPARSAMRMDPLTALRHE